MRLGDVPKSERDRVFRYSPGRAAALSLVTFGAVAALLYFGLSRRSGLAIYLAAAIVVGMLVMRRFILARFRPSNWLVRLGDGGLFLQFRSYLNHHFPADDLTVAFIPYSAVRSARRVTERRDIPYRAPDWYRAVRVTRQTRRLVELELADDSSLAKALEDEVSRKPPTEKHWYGTSGTKYNHAPVWLAGSGLLDVEWGVAPGADSFLEAIRSYAKIEAPVEVTVDYTRLKGLSREEQERRIAELAGSGQIIAAVYVARRLLGYDLTQARSFVDGLLGTGLTTSP
jgi:hypothetical protein